MKHDIQTFYNLVKTENMMHIWTIFHEFVFGKYTRTNLASCYSCSKSANKLCSHCLSQIVNKYGTTCYRSANKLLHVCKQVVTYLFTSCRQVVFALLVPSCCNKFGTSC
jgi:hypothetical protein